MRDASRIGRLFLSTSVLSLVVACGLAAVPAPGVAQSKSPTTVGKKPHGPFDDPELIPIGLPPVPIDPAPYDPGAPVPLEDDGPDDGTPYPPPLRAAGVKSFARKTRVPFTDGDLARKFNVTIPLNKSADGQTSLTVEYYAQWKGHKADETDFVVTQDSVTPTNGAKSVVLMLPTKRFNSDYALVRLRVYNPNNPKKGQHCWIGVYGSLHQQ